MKYTAIIDGERIDIVIDGSGVAEVDGETYAVDATAVEPGVYWFRWKSRSIEISVTPNGEGYVVSVGHRQINVEIVDPRTALKRAARQGHEGQAELRAPMPGKVVKVLVGEGAAVEMNQGLLVIEAMKMQNEIKSPKKGIVKRLGVTEAAAVNAGDLLAIVE